MNASRPPLLQVQDVSLRFGGIAALDGVSLAVRNGDICAVIGPNGAGKTSLFNAISGLYRVQSGDIRFDGRSLLRLPVHRIAALGIGRSFQSPAIFPALTVAEHVMVGAHARSRAGFVAAALRPPWVAGEERRLRERADRLLETLGLAAHADRPAGELPLALRKRVELGRALASGPRLLLLDEPAAGLDPSEVQALAALIRDIRQRHAVTVLLVEHHMALVMAVSDHVVVLNFGRKIAEGAPAAVQRHPAVLEAYLGVPAHA